MCDLNQVTFAHPIEIYVNAIAMNRASCKLFASISLPFSAGFIESLICSTLFLLPLARRYRVRFVCVSRQPCLFTYVLFGQSRLHLYSRRLAVWISIFNYCPLLAVALWHFKRAHLPTYLRSIAFIIHLFGQLKFRLVVALILRWDDDYVRLRQTDTDKGKGCSITNWTH